MPTRLVYESNHTFFNIQISAQRMHNSPCALQRPGKQASDNQMAPTVWEMSVWPTTALHIYKSG